MCLSIMADNLPYLSGGEQTTINSTITELFQARFESGIIQKCK
jgi:hypothetical protein